MKSLVSCAVVYLGFKSLLNEFFYVDEQTIDHFGIESEFLHPIHTLKDLDELSYHQRLDPKHWVFTCRLEPSDLRGTGAGSYIQWGSLQETRARKQAQRVVKWPDAPALSSSKHWYWPAAPLHPARIALRKGIGRRYAPFLFDDPTLLDQRLYLLFPRPPVSTELLSAYCASTLLPWALEVDADLGLGAGVLTLGANSLRNIPVLDVASVAGTKHEIQILKAACELYEEEPPESSGLVSSPAQRALDIAWLSATGNDPSNAGLIASEVAALAEARLQVARRRKRVQRSLSQQDLELVMEPLIARLERWLDARHIPEDFFGPEVDVRLVELPSGELEVQFDTMLGQCVLRVTTSIGGQVLLEDSTSVQQAELILRCLQLGRRRFRVPLDQAKCEEALHQLAILVDEFENELGQTLGSASIGARHEDTVREMLLERCHVPIKELRAPFGTMSYATEFPAI